MEITKQNYYNHLSKVQGLLEIPIDIMSITGFMDWDEKVNHLIRYANQVNYNF